MWFTPAFDSLKSRFSHRPARQAGHGSARRRPVPCRLQLEALENRSLLSAGYLQTNLVADQPGVAPIHDPELVDAWGLALNEGPAATFWVSSRATGLSTVYVGDRPGVPFAKSTLTVTIPGGAPTGQVFSGSATDFVVTAGGRSGPSRFITVSNGGHLTGWNPTVPLPPPVRTAHLTATTPGAIYTGLAIGNNGAGNFLYAADFSNGKIDVFNRTFTPTTLAGSFTDPTMRDDYAPFNIQRLGGHLYVTYAQQHDDGIPHGGNGFVSVFDMNGNFLNRLISEGGLQAPWGLTLTPGDFGEFGNALLVGNFHGGRLRAYNPTTGAFLGELRDPDGQRIEIDGLWGLAFGNANTGDPKALYFTAGPDNQRHGLFGSVRAAIAGADAGDSGSHVSLLDGMDLSVLRSVVSPGVLRTLGDTHDDLIPAPGLGSKSLISARSADPSSSGRLPADHSSLLREVGVATATTGHGERPAALNRLSALDSLFGDEVFGNGGIRR